MSDTDDVLIPIEEVARRLGISHPTIWRHCRNGILPKPVRIGGATRWRAVRDPRGHGEGRRRLSETPAGLGARRGLVLTDGTERPELSQRCAAPR